MEITLQEIVMDRYICDPALELNGHSAAALIRSINRDNYMAVLKAHGLDHIESEQWYSMQAILDVLAEIGEQTSGIMDLVSIGMAAGDGSILPAAVLALPPQKLLETYAAVFPSRHRGGDPGWITVEHPDAATTRISSNTVYPDDLFYGLMYGLLRRVAKPNDEFVLHYGDQRDRGAPATIIVVEWKS
jgi:hypothetical protein